MKNLIKKLFKSYRSDSESYVKWLRKKGCLVGTRTVIYNPQTTLIDVTRPWMIKIGDDVKITEGVTVLSHGYDWSVLKGTHGEVLGSAGKVEIGNNVFIGVKSTILKGVTIGDNVIIGANSLVNKDVQSNSVWGGVPARYIMSIEEYYDKRKRAQISEAKELYQAYWERYQAEPEPAVFDEFFWLFAEKDESLLPCFEKKQKLHGNEEISNKLFFDRKQYFQNYKEFIGWCKSQK